jgi:two-component system phosphate regulon sensor histidine kinase PhoR
MKISRIGLAASLMVLSLSGLILIQVYWITKTIEVNKTSFSRHVNDALQNLAVKLERKDAFAFVSKKSLQDTMILPGVGIKSLPPAALKPYLLNDLQKMRRRRKTKGPLDLAALRKDSTLKLEELETPPASEDIIGEGFNEHLTADIDSYVSNHKNVQPEEINKILKKKYLLEKLAVDMCRRKSPLQNRINFSQLDTMLKNELANQCIRIPCQYGILHTPDDSFSFLSPGADTAQIRATVFKAQLFPNDFFLEPNYLNVSFPDQNVYFMKRVAGVVASSVVFIVVIFFAFLWIMRNFLMQKKLSEMKTDFINNMTHEFKTPITTISLASEALKDPQVKKDENRLNRFADMISEENKRLEGQVDRVLQMARMDKGELKLKLEKVDMHALIRKVAAQVSLSAEERQGKIDYSLEAENFITEGDPLHLANVIHNLLDNAIKYSPEAPEIHIRTLNTVNGISVQVKDNGIGMNQDAQYRIFEKFYRVPSGNVHNVKGFGLGLSYVKMVVNAHGGEVNVKSALGKGSTFIFYLPLIHKQNV